ncbi:MAG TPA: acetate kinase, partial [Burkholderiaceae bacterium]|nr:acetate kinase [Burkholderiaceae bacterium]
MTKRPILVLNCGSSSIKFALYDGTQTPLPRTSAWQGKVQGIGTPIPQYEESGQAAANVELDQQHPHTAALELILDRVQQHLKGQNLLAVAHRVVHGGPHYFEPVVVNQVVIDTLRSYTPLAPLHQP